MRSLLVLLLLVLAVLLAYRQVRERRSVSEETRFAPELAHLTGNVFGPLEAGGDNAEAEIRRVMERARRAAEAGRGDAQAAQISVSFCRGLLEANAQRQAFLSEWQNLQGREFASLSGTPRLPEVHLGARSPAPAESGPRDARQFHLDAHLARWEEYVRKTRPAAERRLEQIREAERGAPP
jgi:hypothetical protein